MRLSALLLLLGCITSAWSLGCPKGWTFFSDYCYLVGNGANWAGAEANCVKEGAHLASVHSKAENDFLVKQTTTGITQNAFNMTWIGAKRSARDVKKFEWTDGTPFDYTNWYAGQPNELKEECLQLFSDNYHLTPKAGISQWNDASCSAAMKYICKKRPIMEEPLPAAPVLIVPPEDIPVAQVFPLVNYQVYSESNEADNNSLCLLLLSDNYHKPDGNADSMYKFKDSQCNFELKYVCKKPQTP